MTISYWRAPATAINRQPLASRQSGQAMAEGIAVLGVLLSIYGAIAWLGRFQDMALSAQHASRHAAFQQARSGTAIKPESVIQHYFSGPAHQWADRRGQLVLGDKGNGVGLSIHRQVLGSYAQPGGHGESAEALRNDWGIQDPGVLHVGVSLSGTLPLQGHHSTESGRFHADIGYPPTSRHTAILTGAGHASGDTQVQQVLGRSPLAWGSSASASYTAGGRIAAIMNKVDSAWNRPAPEFDWLASWAGRVPEHHLTTTGRQHDR